MLSEWSAECAADDPLIEVPWQNQDGSLRWIDLRTDPDALDAITEADEHPPLLAALRTLNASRSPVFTSKCDVWTMDADELQSFRDEMMLSEEEAADGISCYIDLLFKERSIFASRHRSEQLMHRLDRTARDLPHSLAAAEWTLRHAMLDLDTPREGYAITLYVKGCGADADEAAQRWGDALRDLARTVRNLEANTP